VVGIRQVFEDDDVMLMSDLGKLVRLRVADISRIGRNTQGVRLINMDDEQRLIGVVRVEEDNGRSDNNFDQLASSDDQDEPLSSELDAESDG
jgi:DNA gyrase subunit A